MKIELNSIEKKRFEEWKLTLPKNKKNGQYYIKVMMGSGIGYGVIAGRTDLKKKDEGDITDYTNW
jgi:hypothetical protein